MKLNFKKFFVLLITLCVMTTLPLFAEGKVDVNKADMETLATLKGISKVRAEAIIKYREKNGPYQSIEDLKNVRGIGGKIIEKNKSMITVSSVSDGEKVSLRTNGITETKTVKSTN